MKRITLLFLTVLASMALNARTVETTLWNDAYTNGVELNKETVATFQAGDVLRVYVTVGSSGGNFKIVYKGESNGWAETIIPSIGVEWPSVNSGDSYADFMLTSADITALDGMNIYIYQNQNESCTIDRVSLLTEEADEPAEEGTATTLWSGTNALGDWSNFESLRYEGKGELVNAKVGDDIRVTFSNASEGWQVYVCDAASYSEFNGGYFDGPAQEETQSVSFRITNATVLEAIQDRGIVVKGKLVTMTKIEIVTYTTSYDAVAVTIGDDGIATFSSSKHLDFSGTGVTPYYASAVAAGSVTLTSTATTWSWQGYILKGSANTYTIPVTAEANASYPSTNYLKQQVGSGTVAASTEGTYHYIFAKKNSSDDIAFYKLTANHTLGAKKAYLETNVDITPTTEAKGVSLFFSDEETGISTVQVSAQDDAIYTLSGVRVSNPIRGLYIVGGRKVFLK